MSLFTVNRQQYDQSQEWISPRDSPPVGVFGGGTGLPFYLNQLSQSRYGFNNKRNGVGGIYVPSNKLPTWQLSTERQFVSVFLIKASTDNDTPDDAEVNLPFDNNFLRFCYNNTFNPDTFQTIICDDRDRDNILDCGQYYFKLGLEDYPDLFSEIFTVWDYNFINVLFTGQVFGISGQPGSQVAQVALTYEFKFDAYINVTGGTIDGNPITGNPMVINIPSLPLDIVQETEVILTTSSSGTYKQKYEYFVDSNNLSAGVQITKIYR